MKRIILIITMLVCQACQPAAITPDNKNSTPIEPTTSAATTPSAIVKSIPSASVPPAPTPTTESPDLAAVCRADVDGINALLDGLTLPDHFAYQKEGDYVPHDGDFDPNSFFTVLTHLSMFPNHTLDYVFLDEGLGGYPQVYAREVSSTPYTSPEMFQQSLQFSTPGTSFFSALHPTYAYLDRVLTDGTPESYLEYMLLFNYGGHFYRVWHSNYEDSIVLCDSSDLTRVESEVASFGDGAGLPADVASAAQKIDFTPTVSMTDTEVVVRYVYFTKWGGFYEQVFTLNRTDPYQVINYAFTNLVAYDCGIVF